MSQTRSGVVPHVCFDTISAMPVMNSLEKHGHFVAVALMINRSGTLFLYLECSVFILANK